jgi:hypothetical protein
VFNKDCERKAWEEAEKPFFFAKFNINVWVGAHSMTKKEKENNSKWKTTKGYLKEIGYKEAWEKAWKERKENDEEILKALPNFDAGIFYEITGIELM